jgi:RNA ligase (TIGR02306 family)
MSSHKVLVTAIDEVLPHPNADRLELVRVGGWICVTGKGNFTAGDHCVYIPIDSVLPPNVEGKLFPPDSKVKLTKSRVKTAKIRGAVSQGMAVPMQTFGKVWSLGTDVASELGITKYQPPVKMSTKSGVRPVRKSVNNPYFHKYTDLENIKNYHTVFQSDELVVITEKIHGTNFRCGWVPFVPRTWWHRLKKYFGFAPEYEFVYGSRNLQLQDKIAPKTYYDDNVYAEAVRKYNLKQAVPHGYVVYGEIYGPSIQKGYHYGCKPNERKLVLFDVFSVVENKYLDFDLSRSQLRRMGLNSIAVPLLYQGPFSHKVVAELTGGASELAPIQAVREGVVVRSFIEGVATCGRKILKSINPDYLLSKHADEEVAHDQVAVA